MNSDDEVSNGVVKAENKWGSILRVVVSNKVSNGENNVVKAKEIVEKYVSGIK